MPRILLFGLTLLALLLFSCGGKNTTSPSDSVPIAEGNGNSGNSDTSSGTSSLASGNFLNSLTFPIDKIENASVKDVIPALTDPQFVLSGSPDAAYLEDSDLVVGVYLNGESRAYPHKIG